MKTVENLCGRRFSFRIGLLEFAGVIALIFVLSSVFSLADEVQVATGYSENARADVVDAEARKKVADVEKRLKAAESSLEVVESRLGRATQPPTLTRNFERRVQELERRLDAIERELKKMDALERDMKRMDDRLRRVENRK